MHCLLLIPVMGMKEVSKSDPIYHKHYSKWSIHTLELIYLEIWAHINDLDLNTYHIYLITIVTYDLIFSICWGSTQIVIYPVEIHPRPFNSQPLSLQDAQFGPIHSKKRLFKVYASNIIVSKVSISEINTFFKCTFQISWIPDLVPIHNLNALQCSYILNILIIYGVFFFFSYSSH